MDPEKNTPMESAEELEAEKSHLAEVKEEDLRGEIISEFGFDEDSDKERIDKAVARELKNRKSLSSAIGQKRKYRDELEKFRTTPPADTAKAKPDAVDLDKLVDAKFEKRDLESMEYPDDIKKVIASVASINQISVRSAVSDPYVAAKIESWQKQKEAEEQSISRNNKSGKKSVSDIDNPPDVDMNTQEGRDEYDKWKRDMIKEGH